MEPWIDPLTGQELHRELLGTCANGRLFLRPNGKGIDLYWSNSNLSPGFDEKLRALIKAPAPIAVTKPVNGLHLGCLPLSRRAAPRHRRLRAMAVVALHPAEPAAGVTGRTDQLQPILAEVVAHEREVQPRAHADAGGGRLDGLGVNDKGGSEAALVRRSRSPVSAGANRRVDRDLLPVAPNRYCDDCVWGSAGDQL